MKFNPSWWISNLFLYSLLGLEQNKKNFVSPVCFRCKMVHNGGYRTERLSCKQRSVVLKFVEVGSWKLEWNRHFWWKNPPSLGLFWWRITKFPVWPMIDWHQKFFCADKNYGIRCSNIHMYNSTIKRRGYDWQYPPQEQIWWKIVVQWGLYGTPVA